MTATNIYEVFRNCKQFNIFSGCQDIVVASSLSFGDSSGSPMTRGSVLSDINDPVDDNNANSVTGGADGPLRKFTPSEFVSSSTVSPAMSVTDGAVLRPGTVEDVPVSRPTLPPPVQTSRLSGVNDSPVRLLSSVTQTPASPRPTFKTSKLDPVSGQGKYYKSYLKDIIDNYYEEPIRSIEEEPVTDTKLNIFHKNII